MMDITRRMVTFTLTQWSFIRLPRLSLTPYQGFSRYRTLQGKNVKAGDRGHFVQSE